MNLSNDTPAVGPLLPMHRTTLGSALPATERLSARADSTWTNHTPQAALTLAAAREIAVSDAGAAAGAVVGVYGSGKSTLLFRLLHDALAAGHRVIWEEAAALIPRLLPDDEPVLPQQLPARLLAWLDALERDTEARARYLDSLVARGRDDVAQALSAARWLPGARSVVLLDEVEQAHQLLQRRVASDDGQPLRALIDACGPRLRLVLAYAPESYHSLGDADRGRLVRLSLPALDVASIQATWSLSRGAANFAWWVSRGRARGVVQAVQGVLRPARAGHFDADLHALGDAIDALPGVFGVPALLREGMDHASLRALLELRPEPIDRSARVGGVTCCLRDRRALADTATRELARRIGPHDGLAAVGNELVAVLEACAGDDERCYLTLSDFVAALRLGEARAIEAGRLREPIDGLAEHGARVFDCMGELGPLTHQLTLPLSELAEARFPSPFTDPFLPLSDGSVPGAAELQRAFAPLTRRPGPVVIADDGSFAVFADSEQLAEYLHRHLGETDASPLRALLLDGSRPLTPVVELAMLAGRVAVTTVGRFHATFLRCLALRADAAGGGRSWREATNGFGADRQLERKIRWHRDRVFGLVAELKPRADPNWTAATAFLRQCEPFRGTLARLERDSPALLGLLVPLRPLPPAERAVALRAVALFSDASLLRRLAREANPGGRLSGAAVVVDSLLPSPRRQPRWTELVHPGSQELSALLDRFGPATALRPLLAALLFPEDRARLEALIGFHAGERADVHREREALAAMRRLDDSARCAAAVVADLERCTGRRQGGLSALRLGSFVDSARQQGGPIDALRELAADVEALPNGGPGTWMRDLCHWLVGVFAARLLKGIERDQVLLSEWQRLAAAGADVGRRADEVSEAGRAVGAARLLELVRHRRARFGNVLDDVQAASHALAELRAWVDALAPLMAELAAAQAQVAERGVSLELALADYLPDLDAIANHRALLRKLPEQLESLGDQCPRPGNEGLVAWLEAIRRRAEASRRERARLELEDRVGLALPLTTEVQPEDLRAVEAAWARVAEPERDALRAALQSATLHDGAQLARILSAWVEKRAIVDAWQEPGHPQLSALDRRIAIRSDDLSVDADMVRAWTRARARCVAVMRDLISALPAQTELGDVLRPEDGLAAGELHASVAADDNDGAQRWSVITARALTLVERLGAARERHARVSGDYPAPLTNVVDAGGAVAALEALVLARQEELEQTIVTLRALGVALAARGEQSPSIPPSLTLTAGQRIEEQRRRRLRDAVAKGRDALAQTLQRRWLPAQLLPEQGADEIAAHAALMEAERRLAALGDLFATLDALGIAADVPEDADWDAVEAALRAQAAAGQQAMHELQQRQRLFAARCRRLGGDDVASELLSKTLEQARTQVQAVAARLEALRDVRLHGASESARALYVAVAAGGGDALAAPLAELVALGLLRTIEAEA